MLAELMLQRLCDVLGADCPRIVQADGGTIQASVWQATSDRFGGQVSPASPTPVSPCVLYG